MLLARPNVDDNSWRRSEREETLSAKKAYSIAKDLRTIEGHDEAVPLYKELLRKYPADLSAASHIAASPYALTQQDSIFQDLEKNHVKSDVNLLRKILCDSNFTAETIHATFCGQRSDRERDILQCSATGPIYIKPVVAGDFKKYLMEPVPESRNVEENLTEDNSLKATEESSLICLINLFLLGFSGKASVCYALLS
jgi:hypothetical protein